MLLAKQLLTQEARKAFGLVVDPFGPVTDPENVFLSPDIRYAREVLWHTAKHADQGSIVAIVGESGSGKSTLRRDLITRLAAEGQPVVVVQPFVMGMEANDKKGKTLKIGQIAERVIRTVAPEEAVRASQDARFEQMRRVLLESARAGNKHIVLIEEAHALPKPTLRHLKRLVELENGMKFLVSVALVGQTELYTRLSETDPEVREVVQRCGVCTLHPLTEAGGYLRHRLAAAGIEIGRIINGAGIAALEERLGRIPVQRGRRVENVSLLYPLALQNLLIAALNKAAELGFEVVDADVVRGV
jgi:type II secretory pathway predicted ATPase ExeA